MDYGLKGKVALVCGASQGLGEASALALAREQASLVICARNRQRLLETARTIADETGARVLPAVCDLASGEDLERLVDQALERFGTIDILVTNVGHPQMGDFFSHDEASWRAGFEGVLLPVVRLCRRVIPHMVQGKWGRIVHITSVAVKDPHPPYYLSSVYRAGVAALSKLLSQEFGREGVRVNTVCPGVFKTPLVGDLLAREAEKQGEPVARIESQWAEQTAVGRLGEAAELASLVAFLCSQAAADITGQVLVADGGATGGLY
ncbi:MAG: SDR family oxidoreductase [Acidobacteriota bacterium]|nr:SDR family oxidoreductase [Acidobacteriota bacterium]